MNNNFEECPVCMEKTNLLNLHNNHKSCKKCCKNILKHTQKLKCPLCRKNIYQTEDKEINKISYKNQIYELKDEFSIFSNVIYHLEFYISYYIITYRIYFFIINKFINYNKNKQPKKNFKLVGGKCVNYSYN